MTNSGDTGPVAPRRPLGQPVGSPDAPMQEAQRPSYGDRGRTYSVADAQTGTTAPVPPTEQPTGQPTGQPGGPGGPGAAPARATGVAAPPGGHATADRARAEAARQKAAARAARRSAANRPRQTRRAKLRLTRVDPWSVTKISFLLSIAFGVMCVVAVFLIFSILSAAGVWDHVNQSIQQVVSESPGKQFDIKQYVGMSRVMGITMLISVVDVVLITALATLGAFIYNLAAAMLGGLEVTLAEDLN